MSHREEMKRKIEREAESHPSDCQCQTCRAAAGDKQAMRSLMKELL